MCETKDGMEIKPVPSVFGAIGLKDGKTGSACFCAAIIERNKAMYITWFLVLGFVLIFQYFIGKAAF